MSATAGYLASVKASGTTTAITAEATTCGDPGTYKIFQVTDATKRVLDPGVAVVVKKNTVVQSSALYAVNYLFGTITFTSGILITDAVTVDGSYLPTYVVATAKEFANEYVRDLLDNTTFATAPDKSRAYGIRDVSGSISIIEDLLTDHDSTGATRTLMGVLQSGVILVLEEYLVSGEILRAFVAFEKESVKAALADMIQGSISWKLASYPGKQSFAFGT